MNKTVLAASLALALALSGAGNMANAHEPMKSHVDHVFSNAKADSASATLVAGPATLVNTTTAGYQYLRASNALEDGGYLLVWETTNENPSDAARFYFQRFDSKGRKIGGETRLPIAFQDASIAVLTNGDIVVAYRGARDAQGKLTYPPSVESGAFIQRFDASGHQVLRQTAVASTLGSATAYDFVKVVPLADGEFVVHWRSDSLSSGTVRYSFSVQSFDNDSQRIGSAIVLSADNPPATTPIDYSIKAAPNGGFVLYKSMFDLSDIRGCFGSMSEPRIISAFYYDENLVPKQIIAPTHCAILLPLLANQYMFFGATPAGPYSQLMDENGSLIGPQKPIAAATQFRGPPLSLVSISSLLADGSYLLIWNSNGSEFKGQRYTSKGDPIGEVINNILSPRSNYILPLAGGDVILAWDDFNFNGNTTLTDIYTQRLSDPDEKNHAHKHWRLKSCLEYAKGMKGHARIKAKVECLVNLNKR